MITTIMITINATRTQVCLLSAIKQKKNPVSNIAIMLINQQSFISNLWLLHGTVVNFFISVQMSPIFLAPYSSCPPLDALQKHVLKF